MEKNNLYLEIETAVSEFEQISQYINGFQYNSSDRFSKIKLGAAHSKKTDCILTAMKLNDLLLKYYQEAFPFSGHIQSEIDQYKQMTQSIKIENGQVTYPKQFLDFITEIESKINKINGN